jgi:voltage-gated potassium channel
VSSESKRPPANPAYSLFILIVSTGALLLLGVSALQRLDPATRTILEVADLVLCVIFLIDFVVSLVRAPRRLRYLYTWGWLDLLSSIPAVGVLRLGRLARVLRLLRLLRNVRSARILAQFILERRAQSALLAGLLLAVLLFVAGSIAILHVETRPDANIRGPGDALWWTLVTLTTVGYGDRYPVTAEGRAIAGLLMLCGIGLIGTLTGFIASWFLAPSEREQDNELAEMRREMRELRGEIGELRATLTAARPGPGD